MRLNIALSLISYGLELLLLDTVSLEQGINGRFTTTELFVQVHRFLRSAFLKDVLTETFCGLFVKDRAVLFLCGFEDREGVCI